MSQQTLQAIPSFGIFLLLLLFAAPHSARAQSADRMVVSIPFAFSAGSKRLPAGEYSVKRISPSSSAFTLQRADGGAAAIVLAAGTLSGGADRGWAGLVLRRYGRAYALVHVRMPGSDTGDLISVPRAVRRLRREAAATGGESEQVTLLARWR